MRTAALWCGAVVVAAGLLVATGYHSRDPDSALYTRLSGELAKQPPSRWIAPEWGGAWNQDGLFREHPVGILIPSVLVIRAGFPAEQAPYAVNMLYQVAVILLIPLVAGVLVTRLEAWSLAWLLQLLPIAFTYRIRANQEHPLLMCFLALLYATHRSRTSPAWIGLMVAAFCGLVLLKGAFAMFALVAAVLWLLLVPMPPGGANRWPWAGLVLTVFVAAVMVAGYEGLYVRATGESFLDFYRSRRLGDSIRMTDVAVVSHALVNVGWYLTRLAWFAAPWSLIAIPAAVGWARSKGTRDKGQGKDLLTERALLWAMLLTAAYIAVLSPALVRAERFIFPTYFVIGAVGAVTAMRNVDAVRRVAVSAEPHSWLPVAVWFGTFVLSLGSRIVRL